MKNALWKELQGPLHMQCEIKSQPKILLQLSFYQFFQLNRRSTDSGPVVLATGGHGTLCGLSFQSNCPFPKIPS